MIKNENDADLMEKIKKMTIEGKIDATVEKIAFYLNRSTEQNYIDRLENIIEAVSSTQGGRTVIRFLIERLIIDIPSLLENLSKRDSMLRYSFLLLLKSMCENESDLFLPFSEDLLNSDDPNVREADLQLLIFMAGGGKKIEEESLIKTIASKLADGKDFVVQKAIQMLKTIGKESPSIITRVLTEYAKECPETEELKKNIDDVLKSIVTIEKIEEIVEEEVEDELKKEIREEKVELEELPKEEILTKELKKKEVEIQDKELELKKKEIELKKKKLEIKVVEKELKEKKIEEKVKTLELKKEILEAEIVASKEKASEEISTKALEKEEAKIIDKELELKKKDLELKKKKLEIEERETKLEEKQIKEIEKALKLKEELIEKEKELSQVELELKQKEIKDKEKEIKEQEAKRVEERLKKEE